jgi:hypothetical protein
MRSRLGLIIASLALLLLVGFIWWSEKQGPPAPESKAAATTKLLTLPVDQIESVTWNRNGQPAIAAKKDSKGLWGLAEGMPNREAIIGIVNQLASLEADSIVDEKATDWAAYGLDNPGLSIDILLRGGRKETLYVGEATAVGGRFYARRLNDPRLYTLSDYNKAVLDKSAVDLSDQRLLPIDLASVEGFDLSAKGKSLGFARVGKFDWKIVRPAEMRVDGWALEEILRKVGEAKRNPNATAEDQQTAAASFALAKPLATLKLPTGQTLELRRADAENYFARSSMWPGIWRATKELGEGLDKGEADLRSKKLFDIAFSDPSRVQLRAGAQTFLFEKVGMDWRSAGKTVDSAAVQALIDRLRDLSATGFLNTTPTGSAAGEVEVVYGNGKLKDTVSFFAEGARRANDSSSYATQPNTFADLQQAAANIREVPAKK